MFKARFNSSSEFNAQFSNNNSNFQVEFLSASQSGSGLPRGGDPGDILIKRSTVNGDAEWVPPANSAEEDNTRPITAAAVYTEIGNINALLATI